MTRFALIVLFLAGTASAEELPPSTPYCPDGTCQIVRTVQTVSIPVRAAEPLVAAIRDNWTSTVYARMARGQDHLVYQHLVNEHGYTQSQVDQIRRLAPSVRIQYALMCHNLAHGPLVSALIGGREPGQVRLQITTPAASGNCANGQCARPSTTQQRGFFGRLFGR